MMRGIMKWLGLDPRTESDSGRHQRVQELEAQIKQERRSLRRERVLTKLEARSSTRYYNALTDAMTLLRDHS